MTDITSPWSGGCRGKIRHGNARLATEQLERLKADTEARDPDLLAVYRCQACGGWHVGHTPRFEKPPAPVLRIKAALGSIIEVTWRALDGRVVVVRYEGPKEIL